MIYGSVQIKINVCGKAFGKPLFREEVNLLTSRGYKKEIDRLGFESEEGRRRVPWGGCERGAVQI